MGSFRFNFSVIVATCAAIVLIRLSGRLLMLAEFIQFEIYHLLHPGLPTHSITWLQTNAKFGNERQLTRDNRPNILLIIADDLGINDITGGAGVATPNIDSIAHHGLNFTQAYSGQATCAPSRAALYTGRIPTTFGFEYTPVPNWMSRVFAIRKPKEAPQPIFHFPLLSSFPHIENIFLPTEVPTMAEVLKSFGYQNYHIGKWDGGYDNQHSPFHRGYDETLTFLQGASLYGKPGDPNIIDTNQIVFDTVLKKVLSFSVSHNDGDLYQPNEYLTDYFGTQTTNLIRGLADRKTEASRYPWFISLAFNAPHNPFQALKSDYESEEIQKIPTKIGRIYAAMILALDRNIGRIIQTLKDHDEYNNTIIIFTSDNGGAAYSGLAHMNQPFRGYKGTLFEGGIRVPLFIQWMDKFRNDLQGEQVHDMTMSIDLLPSLVSLVSSSADGGVTPAKKREIVEKQLNLTTIDGVDILSRYMALPSEENDEQQNDSEKHQVDHNYKINNSNSTVLSRKGFSDRIFYWKNGHYSVIRYYSYKLQIHAVPTHKKIWFFDLKDDPTEQFNLIPFINDHLLLSIQEEKDLDVLSTNLKGIMSSFNSLILSSSTTMTSSHLVNANNNNNATNNNNEDDNDVITEIPSPAIGSEHSNEVTKGYFYLSNLLKVYEKLKHFVAVQPPPLWPSLVDVPICIDKPVLKDNICTLEDEYIYMAN
jgi:arylsulfatase A-like enzyme